MTHEEYFRTLKQQWQGELVVCSLGTNANEWWKATGSTAAFYMHAAMGFASSFALGLALCIPQHPVWVLDSDGGLAMNMGGLLTEASVQPGNLTHFVLSNRCYQSLKAAPLVNAEQTDYVAMARGAGIAQTWTVDDAGQLADLVDRLGREHRYALVVVEVEPDRLTEGTQVPPLPYEGAELKYRFGRYIEETLSIEVFGPRGY